MDARDHQRQLWLVRESDRRETGTARHGSYAKRKNFEEAKARLALHPVRERDRLDNVTFLYPRSTGPDAA